MRRDFRLPAEDERFLDSTGLRWETVLQGSERWVFVYEHPLPDGYDRQHITLAILISGGYPESQLDMFFVSPPLSRKDGVGIPAADVRQTIAGSTFQRWSRHRTAAHPWRSGEDNLESHYDLSCDALRREFIERPN